MRETWYVLENGQAANPAEVQPDEKGVLRHKSGVAVAMRGQVPSSIGVDVEAELAKAAKPSPKPADAIKDPVQDRVTKPAPSKQFKTR